jgi:hypothetical protein
MSTGTTKRRGSTWTSSPARSGSCCTTAAPQQSAQALSATQEHLDYIADLQFIGLVLGLVPAVAILIEAIW